MRRLRPIVKIIALALVVAIAVPATADAAKRKKKRATNTGYPYSIMNEEYGSRPTGGYQPGAYQPWLANPHQSPLTPLGRAPTVSPVRPLGQPASPPMIVPGVTTNIGTPAIAPARPAGQSFQDRAVNCVQSGSAGGVGAGQIGAYTRGCVN